VKLVEVTGVPASGKSWFIEKQLSMGKGSVHAFDAGVLRSINGAKNNKWLAEFNMWILLLSRAGVSYTELKWILRQVALSNQAIHHRINMARNCLLKLSYRAYLSTFPELEGCTVYIDEGISHIPMVVQRASEITKIVKEFDQVFGRRMSDTKVLCVEHSGNEHVARLQKRGHTRINTDDKEEILQLVATSTETIQSMLSIKSGLWSMERIEVP